MRPDAADPGARGELVGGGAARAGAAAARGAGPGRRAAGRSGVLRAVRAVLRPAGGASVDADGGLPADDVPEVPLSAGLRQPVPRGRRLDHLAAVLPDPAGRAGAAPDHADEAHDPVRDRRGGRLQRGAAGQGGARRSCCAPARLRADTTVVPADVAYPTDSGLLAKAVRRIGAAGRRIQAAGGAVRTRLRDRGRSAGTKARAIGAKLRLRAAQTRDEAQAAVRADHRRAGRAGRTHRHRGREAAAQRPPSAARGPGQGRRARRGRRSRTRPPGGAAAGCAARSTT